MSDYEVKQGDCMSSIAHENNFLWKTLWDDPHNAALKAERKNPNILYPGDIVYLPDDNLKHEERPTDQRHTFQIKDDECKFRVRLLLNDKPRAAEPYQLWIEDTLIEGQSDSNGWVEQPISPGAHEGKLVLTQANEEYPFLLGGLDPLKTISGIQQRLQNLGFSVGEDADGVLGPDTQEGVCAFQKKHGLKVDGQPGPITQAKLKEIHGT